MDVSHFPPWREVVQAAARKAALAEDQKRWGDARTPFDYRWEHVQAVVRLAMRLAECTGADREVCEAAAWLHDVTKIDSREHRTDHGLDGAAQAREILAGSDFPAGKIEAVADAIAKHVGLETSAPVEPLEAAVLWDADKLSKLGATCVLHGVGYKLAKGEKTTPALIDGLCDASWGEGIVRSLNTSPARAVGQARLDAYRAFCQALQREYKGSDLPAQSQRDPIQL
jgi:uncharacterized protein